MKEGLLMYKRQLLPASSDRTRQFLALEENHITNTHKRSQFGVPLGLWHPSPGSQTGGLLQHQTRGLCPIFKSSPGNTLVPTLPHHPLTFTSFWSAFRPTSLSTRWSLRKDPGTTSSAAPARSSSLTSSAFVRKSLGFWDRKLRISYTFFFFN